MRKRSRVALPSRDLLQLFQIADSGYRVVQTNYKAFAEMNPYGRFDLDMNSRLALL